MGSAYGWTDTRLRILKGKEVNMQSLEMPGYTVAEFEKLAGLPKNTGYKLIRRGKLVAVLDVTGQFRIPYAEAAIFVRTKELNH